MLINPMLWANSNFEKIKAKPQATAVCPGCGKAVIPKCGDIISWHWAHKTKDCDSWSEPESQWHLEWKDQFPKDWQEVVIGPHRADVKTPYGVIEFQKSNISVKEIKIREEFYGKMSWVLDASDWAIMDCDSYELELPENTARWRWPRKCWVQSSRPIYLDRGENCILYVTAIYERSGYKCKETIIEYVVLTKRQFIERMTGMMQSKNLLMPHFHPSYGYLKNRRDLLPPWPAFNRHNPQ
jgi:hypothetical protein